MRTLTVLLFAASASLAQAPSSVIPRLQSPEVQSDGRVTFRYWDPTAKQVDVHLEGAKAPFHMQKDASGIWTYTSESLAPDLYGYSFDSDGANRLDPANVEIKPNLLGLSNVVHVPGASP